MEDDGIEIYNSQFCTKEPDRKENVNNNVREKIQDKERPSTL
jgi:hypothetical protein